MTEEILDQKEETKEPKKTHPRTTPRSPRSYFFSKSRTYNF